MIQLYGIPNCDTMRKARKWLQDHGIEYQFHDYKKLGIDEPRLREWMAKVGWETLLNRRGMMWRKLSQEQRDTIDEASALQLMTGIPSIIKRPVLVTEDGHIEVGFSEDRYKELFQQ
ncbi:ArsC family reductase [Thiolapillus brandeum]|uniref:Arsenate reductase n=1 Tax=Thiolapillus brandeum TaxID=1076588 RepID=A0A7U6GJ55_9GAMM|nr:ArsC family reductase [Thiolapillus brandeum]BAO44548.1 arsenate reductase [Thiolapillus brandeum]